MDIEAILNVLGMYMLYIYNFMFQYVNPDNALISMYTKMKCMFHFAFSMHK